MKDHAYETGAAQAASEAAKKSTPQGGESVVKVYLDPSVARALGHDKVEWDGNKPYVKTEPKPAR